MASEHLRLSRLFNETDQIICNTINITQLPYVGGIGSHSYSNCLDVAKSGIRYTFFAPVDLVCKGKVFVGVGNTILFESKEAHYLADGTLATFFYIALTHIDSTDNLWTTTSSWAIGREISQGSPICREGLNGPENIGVHCHIRVGKGTLVVGSGSGDEDIYRFLNFYDNKGYQWGQTEQPSSTYSYGRASQLDTKGCYIIDGALHVDNVNKINSVSKKDKKFLSFFIHFYLARPQYG